MRCLKMNWLIILVSAASVRGGWIDVDTTKDKYTTTSFVDETEYELVMSDEFQVPNRSFADGHDPTWTALDKSDDDASAAGGGSLHFYNSTTCTTKDGNLEITSKIGKTEWDHYDVVKQEYKHVKKGFKSGMMQTWNKFCFTGGIVEIDLILPGEPDIGGLWPAVWMLGNLGRATYEASTNLIWPWSFNECNRTLQPPQALSKCNIQNHFGMNKNQGRGATEIDIIEMMAGPPGPLPETDPTIQLPYVDMTLQVAPGIPKDRPQSGHKPLTHPKPDKNGHVNEYSQVWYEGLEYYGNTSLNPFFYGTFLDETKPEEPVQRTKKQTFHADAVGAMHQLTPEHFKTMHSFRIEWQPGPGGRIDWFTKAYKTNGTSMDYSIEGDGNGTDWVKVYTLKDKSLSDLMGSQIPAEPTYLILNTAISSTWGFPFDVPPTCKKCFDCSDANCACNFYPGFCRMLKAGVSFKVDSVRVYQSKNDTAHVGNKHSLGCDPVEYPTREFIKGYAYRYSRDPPFGYKDTNPLKKVQRGGGTCKTDDQCGANGVKTPSSVEGTDKAQRRTSETSGGTYVGGRGTCVLAADFFGLQSTKRRNTKHYNKVCKCSTGFTGPHCLAVNYKDDIPGAYEIEMKKNLFRVISKPFVPTFFLIALVSLSGMLVVVMVAQVMKKNRDKTRIVYNTGVETPNMNNRKMRRPQFIAGDSNLVVTGRSV